MSTPDPNTPPVGEEIHLPPPTVVPALTAVGIMLTLVGLTTYIEFTVAGALITIGCVWSWIKTARAETDELPLD